ncbi:MAG: GNAT family N-acetyltransferase [Flavobacteriales bacterium]|nr:GNAT family N-acetyltransferase [Flavobacteriales bacterium]
MLFILKMPIRFIKARELWPLRHKVLRPHMTLEDCDYPHDKDTDTFHLATVEEGRILCIGSFYKESSPKLKGWKQYRLRGMATEPERRGAGLGTDLIHFALEHLRAQQADVLWCNARENALPFYAKLGFTTHGGEFDIPGIGPHYLLSIKL